MFAIFTSIIYQPFLNLLVFFYWVLDLTPVGGDMGIAVILLTIVFRLLLLPITLASHRSEKERRHIQKKVNEIREAYQGQPVEEKQAVKRFLRSNPRIMLAEAFMFIVQVAIALILWRIFATGLSGEDLHLLYDWMPEISEPFNLMFLGRFDLTHPDWQLNVLQAFLIFLIETINVITSPYHVSRSEVVRVQLVLPLVSFMIFAFLPAGKKLFVITTFCFSLLIMLIRSLVNTYQRMMERWNESATDDDAEFAHQQRNASETFQPSPDSLQ